MAVRDEDLTLAATVQTEASDLASASTSVLERYIAAASDAIRGYIGRPLHYGTWTERYAALGGVKLVLDRRPILSVTSINYDGVELDNTDGLAYEVHDADAGIILRPCGWPYSGNRLPGMLPDDRLSGTERKLIEVVYVAGWVTPKQAAAESAPPTRTLPFDLEQACVDTVVSIYRRRGRAGDIASESVGIASVSYRNPNKVIGVGLGGVIPDHVLPVLDRYRVLR